MRPGKWYSKEASELMGWHSWWDRDEKWGGQKDWRAPSLRRGERGGENGRVGSGGQRNGIFRFSVLDKS